MVTSESNKLQVQDHYPIVSEPGGEYVTHVTPPGSTGKEIANEIDQSLSKSEVSKVTSIQGMQ